MVGRKPFSHIDAQDGLMDGIRSSARVVGATFGSSGRNVLMERDYGGGVSGDGVSAARMMEFQEQLPNLGAALLKEVAVEMSDRAGDGTSLAVTIAGAMIEESLKARAANLPVNEIRLGIEMAVAAVDAGLCEMAIMPDKAMLERVASTASRGDEELAQITAETLHDLSAEEFVSVELGDDFETMVVQSEGLVIERGYISSNFVATGGQVVRTLESPLILVTDLVLDALEPFIPLLEQVHESGRALLIIAGDVTGEVLSALVQNDRSGALTTVAVQAPASQHQRTDLMTDISLATDAKFISSAHGMRIEDVILSDLGGAASAKIGPSQTHITGSQPDKKLLEERSRTLHAQRDAATSEFEREELSKRLAWLHGKTVSIRVGGTSEDDLKDRRDRAVNCLHALRAANSTGVLPGAGYAFIYASADLNNIETHSAGARAGISIVAHALEMPAHVIISNRGDDAAYLIDRARNDADPDAYLSDGPLDPLSTLRLALAIASSAATALICSEYFIVDGD